MKPLGHLDDNGELVNKDSVVGRMDDYGNVPGAVDVDEAVVLYRIDAHRSCIWCVKHYLDGRGNVLTLKNDARAVNEPCRIDGQWFVH